MSLPHQDIVRVSNVTFPSSGRCVRVERFEPAGGEVAAPVLLLHGADGLTRWGPAYRELVRAFARDGHPSLLVHYFDSTAGAPWLGALPTLFPTWMQAVSDAVTFATAAEGPEARVGLVGFSLGASLALAMAACDHRVGAVVECFGAVPDQLAAMLATLPPVLILHGEADPVVPAGEARKLERLLRQRGSPFESHLYPGQGHFFTGDALADTTRRSREFLRNHLPPRQGASRTPA